MRPQGSARKLEQRRLRAIEFLKQGSDPSEVARRSRVSVRSVYRWAQLNSLLGSDGLRARPIRGRPPKLTPAQRDELVEWLRGLPPRRRQRGRIWNYIHERFGITYTLKYIGALRRSWGFRPQRPMSWMKKPMDGRRRLWRDFGPSRIVSVSRPRRRH